MTATIRNWIKATCQIRMVFINSIWVFRVNVALSTRREHHVLCKHCHYESSSLLFVPEAYQLVIPRSKPHVTPWATCFANPINGSVVSMSIRPFVLTTNMVNGASSGAFKAEGSVITISPS
ncbi:MAG: hypothetical protein [Caudoviricetes sp.]|nr:MAG: hypothetical protein [Caudoviricetes sp.]